ncbi:hypothetical protein ACIPWF_20755 [Paenarthrobacter sp. NPDC089989]|uniref:hypothetical protein n=1 Tax=unclassified Paenarthrobacter TaxID=2634190 RepID=UPI003825F936
MDINVDELVQEAEELGRISEQLRLKQLVAAHRRQEAILSLHALGLSIRDIAKRIHSSPAVVQASLKSARSRRPHLVRREERIPFELHVQLSLKLHADEEKIRSIGRAGVRKMRERPRSSVADEWVDKWDQLLGRPVAEINEAMLEDSPFATELRQMSPFAGALSEQERLIAIKKAAALAP